MSNHKNKPSINDAFESAKNEVTQNAKWLVVNSLSIGACTTLLLTGAPFPIFGAIGLVFGTIGALGRYVAMDNALEKFRAAAQKQTNQRSNVSGGEPQRTAKQAPISKSALNII